MTAKFEGFQEAPRPAMGQSAFRRYEKWIARATKGSYVVGVEELDGTKASSWAVGFNEARRGFLKFHYHSYEIPIGYDLSKIKVKVGVDGRVLVENKWEDEQEKVKLAEKANSMSVVVDANGAVVHWNSKTKPEVEFVAEDRVNDCIDCLQTGVIDGFKVCYLVRPTEQNLLARFEKALWAQGEKIRLKDAAAPIEGKIAGVELEKLDHGWWRLQ